MLVAPQGWFASALGAERLDPSGTRQYRRDYQPGSTPVGPVPGKV
jgi:hypothetical protein